MTNKHNAGCKHHMLLKIIKYNLNRFWRIIPLVGKKSNEVQFGHRMPNKNFNAVDSYFRPDQTNYNSVIN